MVTSVRVSNHGLRASLLQHLFNIGEHEALVKTVPFCIAGGEFLVRLGNADDVDIGMLSIFAKESRDMPMDEADDADSKRSCRLVVSDLGPAAIICDAD